MKEQFLIEELKLDTVIHTPTKKEAKRIMALLDSQGYTWGSCSSSLLEESHWSEYESGMCYSLKAEKTISYSDLDFYTTEKYFILPSSQIVETKSNINQKTTPMKEQITLLRRGFFVTENFTETQCTTKGHTSYTYSATLRCGYKLDEYGFLIDHALLHKAIVEYIKDKPMYSCEVMSKQLAHLVVDLSSKHGCSLKEIDFTIIPVNPDQIVKNGEEWVAVDPMSINYNRPANAIYNLIIDDSYTSVIPPEDKDKYIKNVEDKGIPVTKDNAFVGMRVIKGEYWSSSNTDIEEGEVGTILRHKQYFPEDPPELDVRVNWDTTGNIGESYYITKGNEELSVAPDTPLTEEEYKKSRPEPVNKSNLVVGMRVIKGDHWSSSNTDIEDGEIGVVMKGKGTYPLKPESNLVIVNWGESGIVEDSYSIEAGDEELSVAPVEYKGEIADFPKDVVEKMLELQKLQGKSEHGIKAFESNKQAESKGFNWRDTEQGHDFWHEVIIGKNFDKFYEEFKS